MERTSDAEPIELVVVEDDPRTLRSLIRLLSSFDDFRVVGSALSGESALECVPALQPRLVVLDLELPGKDGITVTAELKAILPEVEVLILTSFEDETKVFRAIQAGAGGYLVKRVAPAKIHEAILQVLAGGTVIESRLARRFWNYFQSVRTAKKDDAGPLDPLERDILQVIARGLSNQEAGRVLDLPRRTIRSHLAKIYRKLGTSSRSEAVVQALQNGWIDL